MSWRNPFDRRDFELLFGQQEILDTLKVQCQQGGLCLMLGIPGTGKSEIKQAVQKLPENQHLVATVSRAFAKNHNLVLIARTSLLVDLDLGINHAKSEIGNLTRSFQHLLLHLSSLKLMKCSC